MAGGVTYQQCGSVWYQPQFVGTGTTYVVVNAPLLVADLVALNWTVHREERDASVFGGVRRDVSGWSLGGCGSAVLSAAFPDVGIGLLGVSLAFGLTVLTMAFAIGHISGCHLNPAVSIGLWAGGRFPGEKLAPYIVAQVLGAVVAGRCVPHRQRQGRLRRFGRIRLEWLRRPLSGRVLAAGRACTEIVMTMMFLVIILGATDKRAPQGLAPLAIGLGLTLIHLISIPVTNTSVNPARSTGVAIYVGGWAVAQLWLFWIAPIVGAVLGAAVYRFIASEERSTSSSASVTEWTGTPQRKATA
jgi:aquaporin Z